MRILYVLPSCPWPARSGEQARMAAITEALAGTHALDLLIAPGTAWSDARPVLRAGAAPLARGRETLRRLRAAAFRAGLPVAPAPTRAQLALAAAIRAHRAADAVLIGNAALLDAVDPALLGDRPLLLDAHDVQSRRMASLHAELPATALAARFRLGRRRRRYVRAETRLYPALRQLWSVSPADLDEHRRLVPAIDHRVIANAVVLPETVAPVQERATRVLFVGAYGYQPNEQAALRLIALARDGHLPGLTIELAGRGATARMIAAAAAVAAVRISGEYADAASVHARADLVACPLVAGGGTKVKVLEALAHGVPCVLTPHAAAGLGIVHGRHALIAEPDGFAAAVRALAADAALRRELARNGRDLVRDHHSLDHLRCTVLAALAEVVHG